jgi:NAD(P)-dependent dehydrogenase (short-subunit alcohol dehydrogenase family)
VPDATVNGIAADLGNGEGCPALVERLPDLDVLVNNMGIFEPKPFEEITDEDWMRFFETNVLSGIRLSRHYVVGMRARNWGRIVFVSSESALQIPAEMIHSMAPPRRRSWRCRAVWPKRWPAPASP